MEKTHEAGSPAEISALIISLQKRELDNLDVARDRLLYNTYPGQVQALASMAVETGISEEIILRTCARIAAGMNDDFPWYRVMDIVRSFYITKNTVKRELRGKE
jgi:hypothetical protein